MVESHSTPTLKASFFPLRDTNLFLSLSLTLSPSLLANPKSETKGLILCLDKSGSMSGTPWSGLIDGAIQVAQEIYQSKDQGYFMTLFYDKDAYPVQKETLP